MVKGDNDVCNKKRRRPMFDIIRMRVAKMPEHQIVIFLGIAVVQVIDKGAEDRSSVIGSGNAALDSRIEHREIRCGYTKHGKP